MCDSTITIIIKKNANRNVTRFEVGILVLEPCVDTVDRGRLTIFAVVVAALRYCFSRLGFFVWIKVCARQSRTCVSQTWKPHAATYCTVHRMYAKRKNRWPFSHHVKARHIEPTGYGVRVWVLSMGYVFRCCVYTNRRVELRKKKSVLCQVISGLYYGQIEGHKVNEKENRMNKSIEHKHRRIQQFILYARSVYLRLQQMREERKK